jgi:hypothetical protein
MIAAVAIRRTSCLADNHTPNLSLLVDHAGVKAMVAVVPVAGHVGPRMLSSSKSCAADQATTVAPIGRQRDKLLWLVYRAVSYPFNRAYNRARTEIGLPRDQRPYGSGLISVRATGGFSPT